jgi:hypothetical protein
MFNPEKFSPPKENIKSEESQASENVERSFERKESELLYDDLLFLNRESIGLRHVTGRERAEKEMKEGVNLGDAVAVGSFFNLIDQQEIEDAVRVTQEKGSSLKPDINKAISRGFLLGDFIRYGYIELPENLKNELTERFSSVLLEFFDESMIRDLSQQGNRLEQIETVDAVIDKIIKSDPHFLVGKFNGADMANKEWSYPMGKCHKQNVSPENIYSSFNIERSDFDDLPVDKNLPVRRKEGDEIFAYTYKVLLDKFSNKIRDLRLKKEK